MVKITPAQIWFGGNTIILFILLITACSFNGVTPTESSFPSQTLPTDAVAPGETKTVTPPEKSIRTNDPGSLTPSVEPAAEVITLPPQGLYESCLPEDASCLERLTEMGAQGFKIVLNDGLRYASSAAAIRNYADHARSLGMEVILPVKYFPAWDADDAQLVKEFPVLANEGGCSDNESFLTYYVHTIKDHPAFWGYYIADEIHSEYYPGLAYYSEFIKNLDPHHPRLIVEEGTNDPMEIFFTFPSFMSNTTDVIALDYYPYGTIDLFRSRTRFTGESARTIQHWSARNGLANAIVLQAFAMPQYYALTSPQCLPWPLCASFPTREQMQAQRDQALQYSKPELILWFSYPDILRSNNPQEHWMDLVAAAFAPLPEPVLNPVSPIQNCPNDWICEDIGAPKAEGSQSLSDGVWFIQGAGWDIFSKNFVRADQFHFVYQTMDSDGEIQAMFVDQKKNSRLAKAGIMLRKTFDPVSPYYALLASQDQGMFLQYRTGFREDTVRVRLNSPGAPVYLKIVRQQNKYSAYFSTDGAAWTQVPGSAVDLPSLDQQLMAGLAVTSGDGNMLSAATFKQVSIK